MSPPHMDTVLNTTRPFASHHAVVTSGMTIMYRARVGHCIAGTERDRISPPVSMTTRSISTMAALLLERAFGAEDVGFDLIGQGASLHLQGQGFGRQRVDRELGRDAVARRPEAGTQC